MPALLLMLTVSNFSTGFLLILGIYVALKLVARSKRSKLELLYDKSSPLFKEFVEKSDIAHLVYEPYLFAPHSVLQGIFYIVCERLSRTLQPFKFERETFLCADGGTLGIDWDLTLNSQNDSSPVLLIFPGLGGAANNLYSTRLLVKARQSGFKVGTVLLRGAAGLPITSPKFNYGGAWEDAKTAVEFVYSRYIQAEAG